MGTLPLDKACFFMCLALIQTFTSAERQYFNHSNQYLTWDEARNYCQVCYKDLVAVNLDNVKVIIQMNEADHWIGLRKHFPKNDTDKNNTTSDMVDNTTSDMANNTTSYMVNNTTSDMVDNTTSYMVNNTTSDMANNTTSDMVNNTNITSNYTKTPCKSWCKWSNEDPVIFQNWHAGMPVFKSRLPEIKCCSCSCTCPKSTTSVTTSSVSFTSSPSVQTTVMQYLPKSTDQIKGTNEGTSAKINHVPFTSSQAPRTTGAGTTYTMRPVGESITQMSGTKTTNEEENTTVKEEKTTMPTNPEIILKCTMKENTTPGQTTNQEGLSTVRESTTDLKNLRKTTNQEEFNTVGSSTTIMKHEENSTVRESTTGMKDLSVTTTQNGINTVGESTTDMKDLSVTTTQGGINTVGESTTDMKDLLKTTKQDGFNTVEEGMTDRDDLLDTTIQDDFSTAGESTTGMKDLLKTTKQVTTTKEGINTVGDSVADMENILVTTNKEGFSTVGESTTHWKGCETTDQEMSLTCELIKSMTDICDSSETPTPGEISTDSESTTVVTTNQEQQSTFKKSISFTTDKTTSSSITENTQEETTDPQRPDTSTNRATTFDTYESSTGSLWTTTLPSIEETCQQSPFETAILAEINENYIEDSCVVMTSFGTWVERRCSEVLPFICYDDRFFGQVNVTNVTSNSATLTWMPGPGHISHYIVQVNGVELNDTGTDLTLDLFNLTAGSHYEVTVFPVKCGRYLNSQNASFYTKPHRVNDLRVENTTDKSVHLRWNTRDGNNSLYIVKTDDLSEKVKTTYIEFEGLTPGVCYTFIVISTVLDESEKSEGSNITGCTKPAKVSNLHVTNITVNSLAISWEMLEGNFAGFCVTVNDTLNIKSYYVTKTELTITPLMSGTEISISVGALSNYNLTGDITNITNYTAPENVKDLILTSDKNSISATWKYAGSSTVTFIITILEDDNICQTVNTKKMEIQIQNLKSSTYYIVRVHAVSGKIQSPEVSNSIFTLPEPPTNVRATTITTDSISLEWNPPGSITKATYRINLTSIWNETYGKYVTSTSYEFTNLKSGTKYSFEVATVAGDKESRPAFFNATTDADEREISLSMLCSTTVFPSCDKIQTTPILEQIDKYLKGKFEDRVYWNVAANN